MEAVIVICKINLNDLFVNDYMDLTVAYISQFRRQFQKKIFKFNFKILILMDLEDSIINS